MRGFTLLEILVSIVIFAVIISAIFALLKVADISWDSDMGLLDLQQSCRQAMDVMIRELRQSRPASVTLNASRDRVDFFIPGITEGVSYYLSGGQIIREHPAGTTGVLANHITELSFCCIGGVDCFACSSSKGVLINLQAAKTVKGYPLSFGLREQVRLRNE